MSESFEHVAAAHADEALRAYQREQGENYSFYPTVKIKGSVSYISGDATRRMKEWVSDLYAVRQGS